MFTSFHLGITEARQILDKALEVAGEGAPPLEVAAAVVDRDGSLISFARSDRAPAIVGRMALVKAHTAARLGRPTHELGKQVREEGLQLAMFGGEHFTFFGGGLPILVDGAVVGGVGVSGGTEEEDAQLCQKAIDTLTVAQLRSAGMPTRQTP